MPLYSNIHCKSFVQLQCQKVHMGTLGRTLTPNQRQTGHVKRQTWSCLCLRHTKKAKARQTPSLFFAFCLAFAFPFEFVSASQSWTEGDLERLVFHFVRRTPSKSRDCARARNATSSSAEIYHTHETLLNGSASEHCLHGVLHCPQDRGVHNVHKSKCRPTPTVGCVRVCMCMCMWSCVAWCGPMRCCLVLHCPQDRGVRVRVRRNTASRDTSSRASRACAEAPMRSSSSACARAPPATQPPSRIRPVARSRPPNPPAPAPPSPRPLSTGETLSPARRAGRAERGLLSQYGQTRHPPSTPLPSTRAREHGVHTLKPNPRNTLFRHALLLLRRVLVANQAAPVQNRVTLVVNEPLVEADHTGVVVRIV